MQSATAVVHERKSSTTYRQRSPAAAGSQDGFARRTSAPCCEGCDPMQTDRPVCCNGQAVAACALPDPLDRLAAAAILVGRSRDR